MLVKQTFIVSTVTTIMEVTGEKKCVLCNIQILKIEGMKRSRSLDKIK